MFGLALADELKRKEPQAPALPQVTDQFTMGFEALETPALTGVDALTAREVGSVSRNKMETGCDGVVTVSSAGPPHPANPPIMPVLMRRRTAWPHFMI